MLLIINVDKTISLSVPPCSSLCQSVYLYFNRLFICYSICLSVHLFSNCLSICSLSVYLLIWSFQLLLIYLLICLFKCLSVWLFSIREKVLVLLLKRTLRRSRKKVKIRPLFLTFRSLFVDDRQCDQMAIDYFYNIWPFSAIKICPITRNIGKVA